MKEKESNNFLTEKLELKAWQWILFVMLIGALIAFMSFKGNYDYAKYQGELNNFHKTCDIMFGKDNYTEPICACAGACDMYEECAMNICTSMDGNRSWKVSKK